MTGPFICGRAGEGVERRGREKKEEERKGRRGSSRRFRKQVERERDRKGNGTGFTQAHCRTLAPSLEEDSREPHTYATLLQEQNIIAMRTALT